MARKKKDNSKSEVKISYIVTHPFYYNGVFYAKGQRVKEKINKYCKEDK